MKPKNLSLLCLLLFAVFSFKSQEGGFMGKKFIIKTNAVNGRFLGFTNADLEYVTGRRSSVLLSFQHFSYGMVPGGIHAKTGRIAPGNNRGKLWETSVLKGGRTIGNLISLGYRHYFNRIVPAPYGYYFETTAGFGKATMTDYYVSYRYKKILTNYETYGRADSPVFSGSTNVILLEPAFGFQRIFKNMVSIDAKLSLQAQYCQIPDEILAAIEHNYFVRANVITVAKNGLSMGPSLYLKIGLLLF